MQIIIDMGHTLTGAGTGANGETVKNRAVGKRLIQVLQEKGHDVINATVDQSTSDLAARVNIANKYPNADIYVSLHLNAGGGTGVETYIYNGSYANKERNRAKARNVQNALVEDIGWTNRGVKEGNFYVIRETKMDAILVELGFLDSPNNTDMNKWDTEKIARALFRGITGTVYSPTIAHEPFKRVVADGTAVGSFREVNNVLGAVKAQLEAGKKNIQIMVL